MRHTAKTRKPRKKRGHSWLLIGTAGSVVLAAVVVGFLALHESGANRKVAQSKEQAAEAGLGVETAKVGPSKTEKTILLIGEARPFYSVTLYARVSGYMDKLAADIGDHVKTGQLLAHIEAPEQEHAYASAKADAFNKRHIAQRMKILERRSLVSVQQSEQAAADAAVAEANYRTQAVLRGYESVRAPFDGVISNRFVDPGALLQNASGSQSASQPLFTLTKADPLRVFMYVDQKDATDIHVGDPVDVTAPGLPDKGVRTAVSRVAAELDPKTRTLLVELLLDDPKHSITAGSYVTVKMTIKTPQLMQVPVQALVMRADKPYLAVVQGDAVHYAKIDMAENDGSHILIRGGVQMGEVVALNLGNSVAEGQKVKKEEAASTDDSKMSGVKKDDK